MKKILLLVLLIFISGCSNNKYYICNIDVENNQQNYTLNGKYIIYYDDNFVTKIEKEEKYISNDVTIIEYFNEYKNLDYDNLNNLYGGFTYTIDKLENRILINSTIDLNNVDIKKMIKNGYLDNDYVISNKLTVSGAKYFYKSKGAICNY